jgi:hypothetical protein
VALVLFNFHSTFLTPKIEAGANLMDEPIRYSAFEPGDLRKIVTAYEETLRALGFPDNDSPVTRLVAKKIIEIAEAGERDPSRLRTQAISELGIPRAA